MSFPLLLLLLLPLAAQAGIQARVEPNPASEGDTLALYLETTGPMAPPAPDTAPLQADFEVLGRTQSTRIAVTNGKRRETHGWILSLRPRHSGHLRIPALTLGGTQSPPLRVEVRGIPPEEKRRLAGQVAIEAGLIPPDAHPYVQQQVLLRVRLYHSDQVLDGRLSDPAPNGDVVLERIGEDRRYRVSRNGRYFNVTERLYVLLPQRSGRLEIPPLRFQGHLKAESRRSGPFGRDPFDDPFFRSPFGGLLGMDPFARPGRAVSARGKPLHLQVRPRPAAFKGDLWLPSAGLTLHDSWTDQPPRLRQGEPVTRTLTLEARGLEAAQLPTLRLGDIPGVEVFPEPPENDDRVDGDWVVGRSRQRFTLVPRRPGPIELPEIRLPWWDTRKDEAAEAVLPPWRLKVAAAPGPTPNATVPKGDRVPEPRPAASPWWPPSRQGRQWTAAIALLLGLSWIWWRIRRRNRPTAKPQAKARVSERPRPDAKPLWRALDRACREGDAGAAERILLDLGRIQWPTDPPLDLAALARRLQAPAGDAVLALSRARYAPGGGGWEGIGLCETLDGAFSVAQETDEGVRAGDLPPLYPQKG